MADEIDVMLDSVKGEAELQWPHRKYYKVNAPRTEYGRSTKEACIYGEANLVSSECMDGTHAPALDIDLPCRLVESGTPGHFHLYIDKVMTWAEYQKLLSVLVEVGIVEEKYRDMCIKDGRSYLRIRPNDPPKPKVTRIVKPLKARRSSNSGYGGGYGY